jgi:hypothetical protein
MKPAKKESKKISSIAKPNPSQICVQGDQRHWGSEQVHEGL